MTAPDPTVFVVDDDEAVRDSLSLLIRSVGLEVESYESAAAFLEDLDSERPGCLVLDVRMPGMSGLELQDRLLQQGTALPVIFITGHGDVPMAVRAMRAGAVDFIEKPFNDQDLLDRIQLALKRQAEERESLEERQQIDRRLGRLTPREAEVMELLVAGSANKQIAARLGLSQRTVEIHRANIMRKMEADSLADLVRMAIVAER